MDCARELHYYYEGSYALRPFICNVWIDSILSNTSKT